MKKFFVFLILLVIALVVLIQLLPSEIKVERSLVMNTQPRTVFNQVNVLKNWEAWSPWKKDDPSMLLTYSGEKGKGSSYSWTSKKEDVGVGRCEIILSEINHKVGTQLDFGDKGSGNGLWIFEKTEGGTNVTWSFETKADGIKMKLMGLFMDKILGGMMEKGLVDIKSIVEVETETVDLGVEEVIMTDHIKLVSIREKVNQKGHETIHRELFNEIRDYLTEQEVEIVGDPVAIYHDFSADGITDIECGIPVSVDVEETERIMMSEVDRGKMLTTGYQDNGLHNEMSQQENSYPAIIARQMKLVNPEMGEFVQPLVNGNGSGFVSLQIVDSALSPVQPNDPTGMKADPSFSTWGDTTQSYNNLGIAGITCWMTSGDNLFEQQINYSTFSDGAFVLL